MDGEREGDIAARHLSDLHLCDLVGRRRCSRGSIDSGDEEGADSESSSAKHLGWYCG